MGLSFFWIYFDIFHARIRCLCILLTLWYKFEALQTIADYNDYRLWSTIPIIVLLIPGLFWLTKSSKLDEWIGLFSYPVYLDHIIATDLGSKLLPARIPPVWATTISIGIVTVLLVFLVEKPVELYRKKRSRKLATNLLQQPTAIPQPLPLK
jgi:peptidoglycan/LPS O-acetylase OafA/YrhL